MSDQDNERRDPKFFAAAILVGLVLIAGMILVGIRITGGGDDSARPGVSPSTPSESASSACGLPDGKQTIPAEPPAAKWELSGKMAAPQNKDFGPADVTDSIHTCFARNPAGALFAAANYLADTANPDIEKSALADSRIFKDENAESPPNSDGESAKPSYQISGYRFEDYTQGRATVALVIRSGEGPTAGQNYAISFTLGWQQGDWRIVVPSGGQPPTSAISSMSGYTPWSGA